MTADKQNEPLIRIRNLNVTYFPGRKHEVRALQDISLTIYPGEFVIFFGPSGCGKSTLLYAIAGLESHASGEITVGGHMVSRLTAREIADYRQRRIGMIFQAFYLIPTLSVLTNVLVPQMALKADRRSRFARAQTLLEHFGVASQAKKLPNELSGGQQQRIAICRALVNNPDIILADEPVGNLDSKSASDVIELIRELNTKEKKTVILVTHDPSHLAIAHRVFSMRDGHIVDVKINNAINPAVERDLAEHRPQLSRELELLIRTYTSIAPEQIGGLLIPFKAKEIVAEVMTGLSVEELERIELEVRSMLISRYAGSQALETLLDRPPSEGGLGLDRRTADKLTARIDRIVSEIRLLQEDERRTQTQQEADAEVTKARTYLMEMFDLSLTTLDTVAALDTAIGKRLHNLIDQYGFRDRLSRPVTRGGVGLRPQTARKIAKHFELVVLGKYEGGNHATG